MEILPEHKKVLWESINQKLCIIIIQVRVYSSICYILLWQKHISFQCERLLLEQHLDAGLLLTFEIVLQDAAGQDGRHLAWATRRMLPANFGGPNFQNLKFW